jgi:hypothetical protein
LLEAETNKYCPGGYGIGAISNLITWVLNFFLSAFYFSYVLTATYLLQIFIKKLRLKVCG